MMATMLLISLLLLAAPARGEGGGGIEIKSFTLEAVDKGYQINLDADITLNNTLEQALEKGIMLYLPLIARRFRNSDFGSVFMWMPGSTGKVKLLSGDCR